MIKPAEGVVFFFCVDGKGADQQKDNVQQQQDNDRSQNASGNIKNRQTIIPFVTIYSYFILFFIKKQYIAEE